MTPKTKKPKITLYTLKEDYSINGLKILKGVSVRYNPEISEIIDDCLKPTKDSIIKIPMSILEKQEPVKKIKKSKAKIDKKSKTTTKLNNKIVK